MIVLVLGLLVAAEFVLRGVAADRLEREASSAIGAPVDVGFGRDPLLLALATREVGTFHLTTPGADSVPRLDLTAHDIRFSRPASGRPFVEASGVIGTVEGTATVTDAQITETAAARSGGGPLGDLGRIRSIRADPASGTLLVGLAAGVEVGVRPSVNGTTLDFTPVEAEVAGVRVPPALVTAVTSAVRSRLDDLPEGVSADGARVVPGGLEIHLTGREVPIRR